MFTLNWSGWQFDVLYPELVLDLSITGGQATLSIHHFFAVGSYVVATSGAGPIITRGVDTSYRRLSDNPIRNHGKGQFSYFVTLSFRRA